ALERAERRQQLATPLEALPRAHPAPRGLLEERGHLTVEQALEFWPKGYADRTRVSRIGDLAVGVEGIVIAAVRFVRSQRIRNGRPMFKVGVADETGRMELNFF